MGYTWEIDAHLQLKRAYALEPPFGTREDWADTHGRDPRSLAVAAPGVLVPH